MGPAHQSGSCMAKHRGGGRNNGRRFATGNISTSINLLTLGDNIAISANMGDTTNGRGMTCLSLDLGVAIRDLTPGEGPIDIVVAHSDYSAGEIIEALSSNAGWVQDDLIEMERSRRMVRHIGTFSGRTESEVLFDGRKRRFKLGWKLTAGKTIVLTAINRSAAALTTGAVVEGSGKAYLLQAW